MSEKTAKAAPAKAAPGAEGVQDPLAITAGGAPSQQALSDKADGLFESIMGKAFAEPRASDKGDEPAPKDGEEAAPQTSSEGEEPAEDDEGEATPPGEGTEESGDDAEVKPEGETEEEEEKATAAGDGLPAGVKATIADLREDRRFLRDELAAVKAELLKLRDGGRPPEAGAPEKNAPARIESLETPEEIQKEVKSLRTHLRELDWLASVVGRDPEKVAVELKRLGLNIEPDADPEQVEGTLRSLRNNLSEAVEEHLPAREKFIQERQQVHQAALTEWPWLKAGDSKEFKLAQEVYQSGAKYLNRLPNRTEIIGLLVDGLLAREARKSKAPAPAARPIAKPPSSAPSRSPLPKPSGLTREQREKRFLKNRDITGLLTSRLG